MAQHLELVVGWKELEMVAVAEYEVPVLGPPEACWKNICYSGMMKPRDVDRVEPSCVGGTSIAWIRYHDDAAE